MTEGTGSAAARLAAPYQLENASRCDLEPIRIFEHRIERASTRKGVRPFAFLPENHRMRKIGGPRMHHRLRSLAALALVCFSCGSTALAQQTNSGADSGHWHFGAVGTGQRQLHGYARAEQPERIVANAGFHLCPAWHPRDVLRGE